MGVQRYRSVEDMPAPPDAGSVLAGLRAACELGRASRAFGHRDRLPRGVHRFRSVAAAAADRAAREAAAPRRG